MTQIVSPSSRHVRGEPAYRYNPSQKHPFNHLPLPEPAGPPRGRHATPLGRELRESGRLDHPRQPRPWYRPDRSGPPVAGRWALAVSGFVIVGSCVGYLMIDDPLRFAASFIADPNKILIAAGLFVLLVLGWIAMVISTHSAARRYGNLTGGQRVLASTLVTALIAAIALPTAFGAQDAWVASDAIRKVFQDNGAPLNKDSKAPDATRPDPWATIPRVTVLLMGSDSGKDRSGIRPDTMIAASIDTTSGNTALVSLPRNLERVPFPANRKGAELFPDGFHCLNTAGVNSECLLNALWAWGASHPTYYPDSKTPGLTATVEGIQEVTGLKIDQYVMLNLEGFQDFVNAIGGLDLNVRHPLPIGGSSEHPVASAWIKPGQQHLNGYYSLWYARSRWSTDDNDRVRRQRCVIGAVVKQANPAALALGFTKIMNTLKRNVDTSISLREVDAWVQLALRVKKAKVTSLAFTNQVISPNRPNIDKMHRMVQQAINPPAATTTPTPSATASTPRRRRRSPRHRSLRWTPPWPPTSTRSADGLLGDADDVQLAAGRDLTADFWAAGGTRHVTPGGQPVSHPPDGGNRPAGARRRRGQDMSDFVQVFRAEVDPANVAELLRIRPEAIEQAQRACPVLKRAELVRLDDQTWLDVLVWSAADGEQQLMAVAGELPLLGRMHGLIGRVQSVETGELAHSSTR